MKPIFVFSLRSRRRFARTMGCLTTVVFLWSGALAQTKNPEPKWTIDQIGYFRAEHGVFFAEAERIHVYSSVPKVLNQKTGMREFSPISDDLEPLWKGEAYYHEVYDLVEGKWVKKRREFSQGPDLYLDFGPCDPMNQLDLPNGEMRKVLPRPIKIKDITEFQGYATVIYSDTPKATGTYSLRVALLGRHTKGWRVVKTLDADEYGHFCGTRTLFTKLANGETPTVLLLYAEEPAGSSNYRAITSYLVRFREAGQLKK